MQFHADERLVLDYGAAGTPELLGNLSGIAVAGTYIWTVSDEGRSIECLRETAEGWLLHSQIGIDDVVKGMPGRGEGAELDLESVDVCDGHLWLAGSHCRVRKKPVSSGLVNSSLRDRPSRHLLGAIRLKEEGGKLGKSKRLSFACGKGLFKALSGDPYLKPFLRLPSKENGLDIEGICLHGGDVLLGLRGPLIDSFAVVVHVRLTADFEIDRCRLSFLDLAGLAVRDLTRDADGILVLAGPVGEAPVGFRLYRWTPQHTSAIQQPILVWNWPEGPEKPEGICVLRRDGRSGVVVLYDNPDKAGRISGSRYTADWARL